MHNLLYLYFVTKFLIIRFSSIGDIVLTSPVVRCLKNQFNGEVEIHFLTKSQFADLVQFNPYIDRCHFLEESTSDLIQKLKEEQFDYIIDLHHNLRTLRVKKALGVKTFAFNKLNIEKWLLVNFKKDKMPHLHVVDRYMETLSSFHIQNDGKGLDYFYPDSFSFNASKFSLPNNYLAFVIGAKFNTKRLPQEKVEEICSQIATPIVLIGGKEEEEEGEKIASKFSHVLNLCGQTSLMESAKIVEKADVIVCNDTGFMHIGAAFQKNMVTVWGNTVPEFGMYPYLESDKFSQHEVQGLKCRPCSKIGFAECPKKHFNCMNQQNVKEILEKIQGFISRP
ncbi:MAG: glycosyltransferase family 9 protein [Crocinitomicaceae bacterium]|nr:glycosyltransferase family 9 protein [Crocinitomicaceae bacterium]